MDFFQLHNGSWSVREHEGKHELCHELDKFRSLLQLRFVSMNTCRERSKERLMMGKSDVVFLTTPNRGGVGRESDIKAANCNV